MIVTCELAGCPYNDQRGFCARRILNVDMNGMCKVLWKKGQRRPVSLDQYVRQPIELIDGEFREYKEEKEEAAGPVEEIAETAPPQQE